MSESKEYIKWTETIDEKTSQKISICTTPLCEFKIYHVSSLNSEPSFEVWKGKRCLGNKESFSQAKLTVMLNLMALVIKDVRSW